MTLYPGCHMFWHAPANRPPQQDRFRNVPHSDRTSQTIFCGPVYWSQIRRWTRERHSDTSLARPHRVPKDSSASEQSRALDTKDRAAERNRFGGSTDRSWQSATSFTDSDAILERASHRANSAEGIARNRTKPNAVRSCRPAADESAERNRANSASAYPARICSAARFRHREMLARSITPTAASVDRAVEPKVRSRAHRAHWLPA